MEKFPLFAFSLYRCHQAKDQKLDQILEQGLDQGLD